jgi:hypothetical protein
MEQSPGWGAAIFSSSQVIPRILRNTRVDYCIERFPPLAPVLSQNNPVFNSILCLQTHLSIILGFSNGLFPSRFLTKTPCLCTTPLPPAYHMTAVLILSPFLSLLPITWTLFLFYQVLVIKTWRVKKSSWKWLQNVACSSSRRWYVVLNVVILRILAWGTKCIKPTLVTWRNIYCCWCH